MAEITPIQEAYAYNISRLAEAFCLDRKTVRKRINQAMVKPVSKRNGQPVYALADVGPALFGAQSRPNVNTQDPDNLDPKARKEWFQSENERLKFQQSVGELIPEPAYRDDLALAFKLVVSFFESLPDKMERNRTFTPAQLGELEKATDAMRAQLYDMMIGAGDD
tara:strand:- start:942 stop:1436 length:495 start_codon:yes stop_codon:yes gene_type:complete